MKEHNLKLITLDTETYVDESGNMQLYCICFYDGSDSYSFYITDYLDVNEMLKDVFNSLLNNKYNKHSIYIHNGSSFDLIFLLKYLASVPKVKLRPLMKDGKFIQIEIRLGSYKFSIKDSLLLLPSSLEKLAKAFGVEQQKLEFNHELINKDNLLKFKDEAIKYCIADCVSLYQVLDSFNREIYKLFKIDISKTPTIPSLAFRIFRTHFLGNKKNTYITREIV